MAPAGEAIAAMSASDVAFADDEIAGREAFHVIANKIDNPDKFVADGHRHGNRFLRPGVPVIDVHVCSADGSFDDPNQHVIATDFGNGNFFEPKSRLGFAFHDGLHRFLHGNKLGESGKSASPDGLVLWRAGKKENCRRDGGSYNTC